MQTFAQHALVGTILASALGAVVLCLVLLISGFKSEPDDERSPAGRLLLIRFGHALAGACFAAALMLSTVAFLDRHGAAALPAADDVRRLEARVQMLEQRLAETESRVAQAAQPSAPVAAAAPMELSPPVVAPATRPRKAASVPTRRTAAPASPNGGGSAWPSTRDSDAMSIQPASAPAARPVTATPASTSDDFGTKAREDWQSVKRGFREAGRDIRSGFVDLGRRIKDAF